MPTAVIGLFETADTAQAVTRELTSAGISQEDIQLVVNRPDIEPDPPMGGPLEDTRTESALGVGTAIASASFHAGVIRALRAMGVPEQNAEEYAEGVRRGGALVVVKSGDERAEAVAGVMNHHHSVHVEERAANWTSEGWKRQFARAGEERGLSPRRQPETVQVGRDRTDAGGARVFVW